MQVLEITVHDQLNKCIGKFKDQSCKPRPFTVISVPEGLGTRCRHWNHIQSGTILTVNYMAPQSLNPQHLPELLHRGNLEKSKTISSIAYSQQYYTVSGNSF